jgi:hypothetical protein
MSGTIPTMSDDRERCASKAPSTFEFCGSGTVEQTTLSQGFPYYIQHDPELQTHLVSHDLYGGDETATAKAGTRDLFSGAVDGTAPTT